MKGGREIKQWVPNFEKKKRTCRMIENKSQCINLIFKTESQ